jgi:hypothetical protein
MKIHLKILLLGITLMLPNAYAQEGTAQASTTRSEALATVESATQALKESAAEDDKEATLQLLAEACAAFPASADTFVTALIAAFTQINANSSPGTAQDGTSKAGEINPTLVGEIVAIAIKAAPGFQNTITVSAMKAAPNAAAQITAAASSPLTYISTTSVPGSSEGGVPPNIPPTPAS